MIKIEPITSALTLALYGTDTLVLKEAIVTAQKQVESLQARYRF
jgi:hypothetical protein